MPLPQTVRARLQRLALLGALGVFAVAIAGDLALRIAQSVTVALVGNNAAQRYQMDSDMMHDAMRGDVLEAMLSGARHDTAAVGVARGALQEHAARFLASLDSADARLSGTSLASQIPELRRSVTAYAEAASAVQAAVTADTARVAEHYARFLGAFSDTETRMEQFGDQIQTLNNAVQAKTAAEFRTARVLIWAIFALFLALGLWFAWRLATNLGGRLAALSAHVTKLQHDGVSAVAAALDNLASGSSAAITLSAIDRLDDDTPDELGEVTAAVNRMTEECTRSLHSSVRAQRAVGHAVQEIDRLATSARNGVLDVRADVSQVEGRYAGVLKGVEELMRAVAGPLTEARVVLERVANRDLSTHMTGEYRGEFARMQEALDSAITKLAQTVGEVRGAAAQVDDASAQLSEGGAQLAEGASTQAANAEEISATLSELASVSARASAQAAAVKEGAIVASASVARGAEAMSQLQNDMQRIKASADATQRIVKTIDEIAFQTNLLALNAAVEAARAGDAGRGFAVVAEEVRALALRAAEAAKQTSALIDEEIANVNGGVAREQQVREQLQNTREQVHQMSITIDAIVEGVNAQSRSIEEIGRGVALMSDVTQRVAANAEESAASAEELQGQAAHLTGLMQDFRIAPSVERGGSRGESRGGRIRAA